MVIKHITASTSNASDAQKDQVRRHARTASLAATATVQRPTRVHCSAWMDRSANGYRYLSRTWAWGLSLELTKRAWSLKVPIATQPVDRLWHATRRVGQNAWPASEGWPGLILRVIIGNIETDCTPTRAWLAPSFDRWRVQSLPDGRGMRAKPGREKTKYK